VSRLRRDYEGRMPSSRRSMFWHAPVCHLPFQPSGRPDSPFSPCGRKGMGGSHRGRCFGTPLCAISRFSHQDAQTPPSPRVGERGWGDLTGVDVLARPCVPSPVSAIRMPRLPLLPVWEKGDGGMRGNGARERRTSLISPKNSTRERGCPRSREKCEHLLHSLTSNICSCILALYSNPV